MQNNPATQALTRAVNRAIAQGAPIYVHRDSDAFTALQGFNLGLCALSGAGRGLDTPIDAVARYSSLMAGEADRARELIAAARKAPDAGNHRHYIDGIEATLVRAVKP